MADTSVLSSNTASAAIRQFKRIEWEPAADISTHELARLMPLLISMASNPTMYWEDHIPPEALRHFKISDQ